MAKSWQDLRTELNLSEEDEQVIRLEKDLLATMVTLREEQGLSQAQLAKRCHVKQPVIARMEKAVHSSQINSMLRVLVPMGYTLAIVPLKKDL